MKIKIEVTNGEIEEMGCDSVEDFEKAIKHQIDNGIIDDEGGNGEDWMTEYELVITVI